MDEGLKSALKQSAATSVVHTVGQRVFLHNFDCKGATLLHLTYSTVPLTLPQSILWWQRQTVDSQACTPALSGCSPSRKERGRWQGEGFLWEARLGSCLLEELEQAHINQIERSMASRVA